MGGEGAYNTSSSAVVTQVQLATLLHDLHAMAKEQRVASPSHTEGALRESASHPSHDEMGPLTAGAAADALDAILRGEALSTATMLQLLSAGGAALREESTVVDLQDATTVTVVGDLHGDMPSLMSVLRLAREAGAKGTSSFGCSSAHPIVFNGDFVDRGTHGMEVLCALLLLKLAHGTDGRAVVLLRGK